jgi:hypothetical protein
VTERDTVDLEGRTLLVDVRGALPAQAGAEAPVDDGLDAVELVVEGLLREVRDGVEVDPVLAVLALEVAVVAGVAGRAVRGRTPCSRRSSRTASWR